MLTYVLGAITLCVFVGLTTWRAKIHIKRRMERQLGRKVDDSELTSITGWMKAHDRADAMLARRPYNVNYNVKAHDRRIQYIQEIQNRRRPEDGMSVSEPEPAQTPDARKNYTPVNGNHYGGSV